LVLEKYSLLGKATKNSAKLETLARKENLDWTISGPFLLRRKTHQLTYAAEVVSPFLRPAPGEMPARVG
jgi:hypothetical protein